MNNRWSLELLPPFLGKCYDREPGISIEDYALKIELLITRIDVLVSTIEEWYAESNMDSQADKSLVEYLTLDYKE